MLHTPVPALAVLGGRDPLMPGPDRVREVGRLAPDHVTIAQVDRAAHALNFSHPVELAQLIEGWLDGRLDDAHLPPGTQLIDPRSRQA